MRILLILESWAETLRERYALQTILTLLLLGALATGGSIYARRLHLQRSCQQRMLQIHQALQAYIAEHGNYPELAFYPDNPQTDANSILVVLAPYGVTPRSSSAPAPPRPCAKPAIPSSGIPASAEPPQAIP